MKIRIRGNSVRLRLTQSEVKTLCEQGVYSERTEFNGRNLTYTAKGAKGIARLQAYFNGDEITLRIPSDQLTGWDENSTVGFYNEMPLQHGGSLTLQVEKDFACLEQRGDDESDSYPNPKATTLPEHEQGV